MAVSDPSLASSPSICKRLAAVGNAMVHFHFGCIIHWGVLELMGGQETVSTSHDLDAENCISELHEQNVI